MENRPATNIHDTGIIPPVYAFLHKIGIAVSEEPLDGETFLPGLRIRNGVLVVDRQRLAYPGDILHEAGHIAVTAAADRAGTTGNVTEDHPEKTGEEMAVMLWSYAACKAIGIPPETVFHPDGYKGDNEWILENYRNANYIGLPLLKWMGLTQGTEGKPPFPAMTKWLRD